MTGAIQYWKQHVVCENSGVGVIVTEYGQLGTSFPQTTEKKITEGKNIGKKNAASAVSQAITEATSRWRKKKKKGYVESESDAIEGIRDSKGF